MKRTSAIFEPRKPRGKIAKTAKYSLNKRFRGLTSRFSRFLFSKDCGGPFLDNDNKNLQKQEAVLLNKFWQYFQNYGRTYRGTDYLGKQSIKEMLHIILKRV